jgi:hypothetical protein
MAMDKRRDRVLITVLLSAGLAWTSAAMILAAGQRYVETLRVAMEPTTAARGVTPTAAPAA